MLFVCRPQSWGRAGGNECNRERTQDLVLASAACHMALLYCAMYVMLLLLLSCVLPSYALQLLLARAAAASSHPATRFKHHKVEVALCTKP